MTITPFSTAQEIAEAVNSGAVSAYAVMQACLARIDATNPQLNAFTAVTAERALATAATLDAKRAQGDVLGPLAGVPFAVKNLFDIKGLPTLAGSKINRDHPPAAQDATLVARLEAAGAVLVGALNMGEYAYDFTGENIHEGPSRNPHDLARMSGGSSGGSGSAVGGAMVPLSLGSDTNGSIRVPSSLSGMFGLKPTFGRLSRAHTFPFVTSLDHLGPFARCTMDLALSYDAMRGPDPDDPMLARKDAPAVTPEIAKGVAGLRIALAGGYFAQGLTPEAEQALRLVATALEAQRVVELPEVQRARASAFIITASEAASLHLTRLRERPQDFDPFARDRLIAGAMIPAALVAKAHRFRRWFRDQMNDLFGEVDIILAPATPCVAPLIGETALALGDRTVPLRPNLGLYTQPISFAGLPVVAVPVPLAPLPIGVQVIAPPWREDLALRVAFALEQAGVAAAPKGVL